MCQHSPVWPHNRNRLTHDRIAVGAPSIRGILGLLAWSALTFGASLSNVKTIYIETLGTKPGSSELTKKLATELEKTAGLHLVKTKDQADAYIHGDGEIWIRGHISLNPRSGTDPHKGQPVYGGLLSVELRGRDNSVLWSYLATPRPGDEDVQKDLIHQVAKGLKIAIEKERHP
jgi:hypothetical protein